MLKILLATDFSIGSINAIRYALSLYKDQSVTFTLAHAYPSRPEMMPEWPVPVENIHRNVESMLQNVVRQLAAGSPAPAHTYRTLALSGEPAKALLALQSQEVFDRIVLGANGEGYSRAVGGVARHIAELLPANVLVVPARPESQLVG